MRLFEGTPFDRPPRCEHCGELEEACTCPPTPEPRTPPNKQTARLTVEKRKRGKTVTVVRGLADEGTHLADVLTMLKTSCGSGGAVKEGTVEVQGDQRDKVHSLLTSQGYRVKG